MAGSAFAAGDGPMRLRPKARDVSTESLYHAVPIGRPLSFIRL